MGGIRIELDPAFGYIVLNIAAFWFVQMWMIVNVVRARKKYNVQVNRILFFKKSQDMAYCESAFVSALKDYNTMNKQRGAIFLGTAVNRFRWRLTWI